MKNTVKQFNRISKIINMDQFYSINLTSSSIRLQGYFNINLVKSLNSKWVRSSLDNGYVTYERFNIKIILTEV